MRSNTLPIYRTFYLTYEYVCVLCQNLKKIFLFSFSCDGSSFEVAEDASIRARSVDFAGKQRVVHQFLRCLDLPRIVDTVADTYLDTVTEELGDKELN